MDGFPYVLGALLGEGSFCQVFHGTHLETKRQVAVKVAYKSHFTGTSVAQRVDSELAVLRKAQHPNIVKLIGVFDLPESINIVLELLSGGDLFSQISKFGALRERDACRIFVSVVSALHYCHSELGICHRDVKLENLLFDNIRSRNVKLVDFGLSVPLDETSRGIKAAGTPAYSAPEVFTQSGYDGKKADFWSAGVVLFILLYGKMPFKAKTIEEIVSQIQFTDLEFSDKVSKSARTLCRQLLSKDVSSRLSFDQIQRDEWVRSFGFAFHLPRPLSQSKSMDELFSLSCESSESPARRGSGGHTDWFGVEDFLELDSHDAFIELQQPVPRIPFSGMDHVSGSSRAQSPVADAEVHPVAFSFGFNNRDQDEEEEEEEKQEILEEVMHAGWYFGGDVTEDLENDDF